MATPDAPFSDQDLRALIYQLGGLEPAWQYCARLARSNGPLAAQYASAAEEIGRRLEARKAAPRHYTPGHCRDCDDETARRKAEADRPTVKRPDLFGNVHDSYRTESELNGWKPKQGALL